MQIYLNRATCWGLYVGKGSTPYDVVFHLGPWEGVISFHTSRLRRRKAHHTKQLEGWYYDERQARRGSFEG